MKTSWSFKSRQCFWASRWPMSSQGFAQCFISAVGSSNWSISETLTYYWLPFAPVLCIRCVWWAHGDRLPICSSTITRTLWEDWRRSQNLFRCGLNFQCFEGTKEDVLQSAWWKEALVFNHWTCLERSAVAATWVSCSWRRAGDGGGGFLRGPWRLQLRLHGGYWQEGPPSVHPGWH